MQDLYSFDYSDSNSGGVIGKLLPTGIMPEFLDRLAQRDVHLSAEYFRR
jgi:hypothetical protein